MKLQPEADRRLQEWLARTESAMQRSGLDADEAAEVLVDLRSHIAEELQRFGAGPHDEATIDSVLSTMDGPDVWEAETAEPAAIADPGGGEASLLGATAALTVVVGLVGAFIIGQALPDGGSAGFTFFCAAQVVAAVMGYVARSNRWGRFALIAAPLLVVLTFIIAVLFPEG